MKKLLLVSSVFLTVTVAHGQTNVYHPFPDSNAVWIFVNSHSNPPNTFIYWYCLKGDTIVNSTTYHKLNICDTNLVTLAVQGGIRQDIATKKVYFICFNANYSPFANFPCNSNYSERLLYNFNAGVGDTIFHSISNTYDKVTSIDSIQLLDGKYRKRFYLWNVTQSTSDLWPIIEGIGSEAQLLWGGYLTGGDDMYELSCFKQNNNYVYSQSSSIICPLPTIVTSVQVINSSFSFSIFPNPFSIQTVLQADKFFKNASLTVYNSFGQKVKEIKNISGQVITLFRDNLPSGLYFIRLTQDNKIISEEKLVITDY